MSINNPYENANELPDILPVFPLGGALLLPRGQLPLNIFEPRYLAMVDVALKTDRMIGMVQPLDDKKSAKPAIHRVGCAGRITQFGETGDGRYVLTLTGVARFQIVDELTVLTPFRQCQVQFSGFVADLGEDAMESAVNRAGVIDALRQFAGVHKLQVDWESINSASNEALVNALSMMAPFNIQEKQALLEAMDLQRRAEVLIAISQMESAKSNGAPSSLQ